MSINDPVLLVKCRSYFPVSTDFKPTEASLETSQSARFKAVCVHFLINRHGFADSLSYPG